MRRSQQSPPLVTPRRFTAPQFIAWAMLVTLGFACLVATQGRPAILFILPLQIATVMVMPQAIRNTRYKRPLTRVHCMAVLGAAAGAAAVIWWLVSHRTAESESRARAVLDFFCHPLFAVPLWLLFLYLGCRLWRRKPPPKDQLDREPGQP